MSPQDRLLIGTIGFTVFLLASLLLVPPSIYRAYRADLRRRAREGFVGAVMAAVLLLAIPYFYDELVGLTDRWLSIALEMSIGVCTGMVIFDVAGFLYRQRVSSARRRRLPGG